MFNLKQNKNHSLCETASVSSGQKNKYIVIYSKLFKKKVRRADRSSPTAGQEIRSF